MQPFNFEQFNFVANIDSDKKKGILVKRTDSQAHIE